MRKLFFVFLILAFSVPAFAQDTSQKIPVRGFIWGLPKEIIKENEKGTFVGEEVDEETGEVGDTLFFLDIIHGIRTTIGYEFKENRLWRVRIFIEKRYFDPKDRLEDLLTIQTDLNIRFGKPVSEEMKWVDKREMNYPDSWGWAIFRGELFMTSVWRNKETEVTSYLGAKEKYKPILSVTYEQLSTKLEQEQLKRNNLLKGL
jgi:hypothetical protein